MSDENTIKPSTALAGKIAGMDICRVPIFQTVIGKKGWEWDMLKAIAACKRLGVKTFEIDAKYNAEVIAVSQKEDEAAPRGGLFSSIFFSTSIRIEGDEWKEGVEVEEAESDGKKKRKGADVLTVYAVVVE